MIGWYLLAIGFSFALAVVLTPLVRWGARRRQIIDRPSADPVYKWHAKPTPLLGGLAIILSAVATWWLLAALGKIGAPYVSVKSLVGITVASALIACGGWLDDRLRLRPAAQIVWPILAVLAAVAGGVSVSFITNPFGGLLYLDQVKITLFAWQGTPVILTVWAALFAAVWLLGMIYTTKILDGLDGLVTGIGVIGSAIVFLLTLRPEVNQPSVAFLVLGLFGACAGFLIYNWSPASIFLGESGSLFIGFVLGVSSIIAGGKIATALFIMGLPILDLAWVIIQRRWIRHTSPFRTADRSHLHFRLQAAGFSVRQSVLILYLVTTLFGALTLLVHGIAKVVGLGVLAAATIGLGVWVAQRIKKREAGKT